MNPVLPNHILKLMSPEDRAKLGRAGMTADEALAVCVARSEKQLQQQLEAMLTRYGIVPIRQRMDRKSNVALGLPDMFFSVHGNPVAWEVKMPGKSPRPEQEAMMASLEYNGWNVRVIHSYDEGLKHLRELMPTDSDDLALQTLVRKT